MPRISTAKRHVNCKKIPLEDLPICEKCKINHVDACYNYLYKTCWKCRSEAYKETCKSPEKQRLGYHRWHEKKYKTKDKVCSRCGFVPEDTCQIDIDHIDGDHGNNEKENLQSLCANCHRLKTRAFCEQGIKISTGVNSFWWNKREDMRELYLSKFNK